MKLFCKGARSILVPSKAVLSGATRTQSDGINKLKTYLDPNTPVEVTDALGETLLAKYPKEFLRTDKG